MTAAALVWPCCPCCGLGRLDCAFDVDSHPQPCVQHDQEAIVTRTDLGRAWLKRYAVDGSALMHAVRSVHIGWATVCTGSRATREYAGGLSKQDRPCPACLAVLLTPDAVNERCRPLTPPDPTPDSSAKSRSVAPEASP